MSLGAGNDFADVGAGAVTADGGSGEDGISLSLSGFSNVTIDLRRSSNPFGFFEAAGGLYNFEYFGTVRADQGSYTFITSDIARDETFYTGSGTYRIVLFNGHDRIIGGEGQDTLVIDYSASSGGVVTEAGPTMMFRTTRLGSLIATGYSGSYTDGSGRSVDYSGIDFFDITTGQGNDILVTGQGDDRVVSNGGDDQVTLGAGNDFTDVGTGADEADGGAGVDGISADLSDATGPVVWNLTTNSFSGGPDSFTNFEYFGTITTGGGDDIITTSRSAQISEFLEPTKNETVNTGAGNDTITVYGGADIVNGGSGLDTLVIDFGRIPGNQSNTIALSANPAGGYDGAFARPPVMGFNGTFTVSFTSIERFVITTSYWNDTITTGDGDDVISSMEGLDTIFAGGGNDRIDGGANNDFIDGGTGDDTMVGGLGDDVFIVDSAGDTVVEDAAQGSDEVRTALASYTLIAANVEKLTGTNGAGQTLTGSSGANVILGAAGSDTLSGGDGNDVIEGGNGNDILDGGRDDDTLRFIASAGGSDQAAGGEGADTLVADFSSATGPLSMDYLETAGSGEFIAGDGPSVSFTGIEKFVVTGTAFGETMTGRDSDDSLFGLGGIDRLEAGSGNDLLDGGSGADTMIGGTGDDILVIDDINDVVVENAGEGIDEIRTSLASYTLLADFEKLTYTGSGNGSLRGNAAANTLSAGAGNDVFFLQDGGDDFASGGAGNDGFYFGGALTAADQVNGGAGVDDQVAIQGNYSLTLGAENLVSVETLAILTSQDNRFGGGSGSASALFSYNVTTVDANVAAGANLIISANQLVAGESLVFDGSAETNGSFTIFSGFGDNVLTGGSGDDGFFFGEGGRFSAADKVNGGAGANDQLGLRGNYSSQIVFNADTMVNVEVIALLSARDVRFGAEALAYSYSIKTNDANVAAGQMLTVTGAQLAVDETLTFDGSSETNGSFRLLGGRGADVLTGGGQGDSLFGGVGADTLRGGAGNDVFLYRATEESTAARRDSILDFVGGDLIDLSAIDARANVGGDQAFSFIGANAFSGTAGELRAIQNGTSWLVEADVNGDGIADLVINVTSDHQIVATDFIL